MDPKLMSRDPEIIEIDDEFVDLDDFKRTPEEPIFEWDALVRKKLTTFSIVDNERVLIDVMKEYLQTLREIKFDDNETFRSKMSRHISFLYSLYTEIELQCCAPDNYLRVMEDILTVYFNCEIEVIRLVRRASFKSVKKYKRKVLEVCKRIIHSLTVYLLGRHDHTLHVLMKANTDDLSDSGIEVLRVLYKHFLTNAPVNRGDESFCRYYILFQKWKEVINDKDWKTIDTILYRTFGRTQDSIKKSDVLRQILMTPCSSTVDVVFRLFLTPRNMSNAYFKYMEDKNSELNNRMLNIDFSEDEPNLSFEGEFDDDLEFNDLKGSEWALPTVDKLTAPSVLNGNSAIKQENDDDDDVKFMGCTYLNEEEVGKHRARSKNWNDKLDNADMSKLNVFSPNTSRPGSECSNRSEQPSAESQPPQIVTNTVAIQVDSASEILNMLTPHSENSDENPKTILYSGVILDSVTSSPKAICHQVKSVEVQVQVDAPEVSCMGLQSSLGLTPPTEESTQPQNEEILTQKSPAIQQELRVASDNNHEVFDNFTDEVVNDEITIEETHFDSVMETEAENQNPSIVNNKIDTGQLRSREVDNTVNKKDTNVNILATTFNGQMKKIFDQTVSLRDLSKPEDQQMTRDFEANMFSGPVYNSMHVHPMPEDVNVEKDEFNSPTYETLDRADVHRYYMEDGRTDQHLLVEHNPGKKTVTLNLHNNNSDSEECWSSKLTCQRAVRSSTNQQFEGDSRTSSERSSIHEHETHTPLHNGSKTMPLKGVLKSSVRVPKGILQDVKLRMLPTIVLERFEIQTSTTIRCVYDKTRAGNSKVQKTFFAGQETPQSSKYTPLRTGKVETHTSIVTNKQTTKTNKSELNLQLPAVVPDSYDFDKNIKNEVFTKIKSQGEDGGDDDDDDKMKLPLKKRKLSVPEQAQMKTDGIIEISYPAMPMISIAEALHLKKFKTPAEKKEMPPLPATLAGPAPQTTQFNVNNHNITYNNSTINYHIMSANSPQFSNQFNVDNPNFKYHIRNVPVPLFNVPCDSYYLPPIVVPFNNVSNLPNTIPNEHTAAGRTSTHQQDMLFAKKERRQRRRH